MKELCNKLLFNFAVTRNGFRNKTTTTTTFPGQPLTCPSIGPQFRARCATQLQVFVACSEQQSGLVEKQRPFNSTWTRRKEVCPAIIAVCVRAKCYFVTIQSGSPWSSFSPSIHSAVVVRKGLERAHYSNLLFILSRGRLSSVISFVLVNSHNESTLKAAVETKRVTGCQRRQRSESYSSHHIISTIVTVFVEVSSQPRGLIITTELFKAKSSPFDTFKEFIISRRRRGRRVAEEKDSPLMCNRKRLLFGLPVRTRSLRLTFERVRVVVVVANGQGQGARTWPLYYKSKY